MKDQNIISVIFVCMGNICRSPTAEGVFRKQLADHGLQQQVEVDSAGTHAYHIGEPPDERAARAAAQRGVDIRQQRARLVTADDFNRFDYVLAMDTENLSALRALCPPGREDRLRLFLSFAPQLKVTEVPDPYYGGPTGFDRVLDLVEAAGQGLLEDIQRRRARVRP
ncbi:MAG: low molecular weight protein-tyrosine-phosphatase [Gammaproteobacteria bacterium]